MSRPAKVEKFLQDKQDNFIHISTGQRGCINCIWYEPYFRQGRGNVHEFVKLGVGQCILSDKQRGALSKPCECYETSSKAVVL